jgi:hypothetical protein
MDWPAFYRTLLSTAKLPAPSSWDFRQSHAYIRDLHVDLADAVAQFRAKVPKPTLLSICADVVTLPENFKLTVASLGLVIAARRIEFGAQSSIVVDMTKSPRASLKLFALEVSKPSYVYKLPIKVIDSSSTSERTPWNDVDTITPKGIIIACFDSDPDPATGRVISDTIIRHDAGMQTMLGEDSMLSLSLGTIFHVATLLLDQPKHSELVASQLAWIGACASQSPGHAGLAVQSAGLLAMAKMGNLGATFVPELSRTVYADTARAHVPRVIQYEQQYVRFEDQQTSAEDRIQAAKLMLGTVDDTVALSQSLVGQAEANLQNAVASLETAKENLKKQQELVEKVGGDFQVSVEWWLEKQKFEASVEIILTVIKAGKAIGALAYGLTTEAAPAVEAAERAVRTYASANPRVPAEKSTDFADSLTSLKKILEMAFKVFELAQKLMKSGTAIDDSISTAAELTAADVINTGSSSNGADEWDIFRMRMDDMLQPAISYEIKDSVDYRQQLRVLAIYGKALTVARGTVVRLGQELLRLRLVAANHEREKNRLKQYVVDLETTRQAKAGLRQMFFQRYLDAKRSLFVALEQYRAAFEYWALKPSSVKPALTDRVSVFENGLNDLEKIALDHQAALASFQPRPQTLNKSFLINDANLLAALKERNETTWTIPLEAPELAGYDRVRITNVRIWLLGAKAAPASELYVVITNSGNYIDRRRVGNAEPIRFNFVSKPLEKVFAYKTEQSSGARVDVTPGMPAWVEMDGDVHDEVKYAYFVPTVFSSWSIRLPRTKNQNLDLSGLSGIRMDVVGSAIPSTRLQGAEAQ